MYGRDCVSYCAALENLDRLSSTRDLSLPDWGHYAKQHFALSHITDRKRGTLFECVLIPGITGQRKYFPNKTVCHEYVPLDANADLSFYAMRCHMADRTQADMRFYGDSDDVRLSETVFTNGGASPINFWLDYAIGFQRENDGVKLALKKDEYFLPAHEYDSLSVCLPHTESDQRREGTVASRAFIRRLALGPSFTAIQGASSHYSWAFPKGVKAGKLGVRYALSGAEKAVLRVSFADRNLRFILKPTGDGISFETLSIQWRKISGLASGPHKLTLTIDTPAPRGKQLTSHSPDRLGDLHIDGFFLVPQNADLAAEGRLRRVSAAPDLKKYSTEDFFAIRSPLARGKVYGVMVQAEPSFYVWTLRADDMFSYNLKAGVEARFWTSDKTFDNGNEHVYGDIRPLTCPAAKTISVRAAVGFAGNVSALKARLKAALNNWDKTTRRIMNKHKKTAFRIKHAHYRQGVEGVMAAALTTISFPQDFGNEHIRHLTPGAFYPTLYQWDAGMQGIGLAEYSPQLSLEGLNTYLCSENEHKAMIIHGTVFPTQVFQYWELFQQTGSIEMLKALYPKMRRYYRFMAGKGESLMDRFGSGLICPWDYFYNSGGWDDYPPQAYARKNKLGSAMSPVVNTAHTIRCAKLMAMAAQILDCPDDAGEYVADAERMTDALLKYSWDEKSGYFSYVIDKGKRQLEFKRGVNFNMGLDGVSPLVAGLENARITKQLVKHCKDPKRLWTRMGLTTVDQSAPYFELCGYPNGAVWVPHQWFMFKSLLDYGETAFALKLGRAIVTAYCRAVDERQGQVVEGIEINTGRGYGTPYFSALSLPVVPLYMACFEPGRLTAGFDTLVKDVRFDSRRNRLSAIVSNPLRPGKTGIIAVMTKPGRYTCQLGSVTRYIATDNDGRLAFNANVSHTPTLLKIAPIGQGGISDENLS